MAEDKVRTLTIDKWHELAMNGAPLPMRVPINGISMAPLIRRNRDMVTIMPLKEPPVVGDIVMFSDPRVEERYVLHRLWKVEGDRVLTWGDNCVGPDAPLTPDRLWGKAVLIERGKRVITPKPARGLRWARFRHPIVRVKQRLLRLVYALWRRVKPFVRKEKNQA